MSTAAGETNLARLLATLEPALHSGDYVFCAVGPAASIPAGALGWFREAEGVTLILPQADADAQGFSYEYVAAWLTLTVHSSLAAVGLTAAVAGALTQENISCNVVAAFYHDHLFVARADADRALGALRALAAAASASLSGL
ncbi:ACT domain-containing protein [Hymenobacter coccineus]|uniref:Acetyltransferase n=1 Tax=Hymenobacter coccineus TaxID=1908235 RepID=A0A1G1TGW0_9BACT|nr:ACT domain-containing protein [Hymenobacter coccineus]OGX90114.1 acetyltransferase [Hymenobacter coccineus]